MLVSNGEQFEVATDYMRLTVHSIPWDSEIFGFPVAAIQTIEVHDEERARDAFASYEKWIRDQSIELVSCRLPHDRVLASMFLERHGFRFVEMVLHPTLRGIQSLPNIETTLRVESVLESEVPIVAAMAERAFGYERYHMDPRVDSRLADLRYARWIRNGFGDERQVLLKIVCADSIAGFFVIENKPDGTVYWHLTAINPDFKGRKVGTEVWRAMMTFHQKAGMDCILTTISARNTPALNLYSKLNFRFSPPEITLHWFRKDCR